MDPDPGGPKTWVTGSNTVTTVTVSLSYAGISRRKSWARFPRSGPAPQRSFSRTSGQYLSIWSIVNPDSRDRIVNSILIGRKTLIFTVLCICYCLSWNNDEKIPESIQKIFWMAMSSLIRNTISKFIHCNHFRSVPDDGPAPSNRLPDGAGDVGTSSLPYRKEAR